MDADGNPQGSDILRTFLSTLCHEFCHHLDVRLFGFADSWYTRRFYERTASLYHLAKGRRASGCSGVRCRADDGRLIGRERIGARKLLRGRSPEKWVWSGWSNVKRVCSGSLCNRARACWARVQISSLQARMSAPANVLIAMSSTITPHRTSSPVRDDNKDASAFARCARDGVVGTSSSATRWLLRLRVAEFLCAGAGGQR